MRDVLLNEVVVRVGRVVITYLLIDSEAWLVSSHHHTGLNPSILKRNSL